MTIHIASVRLILAVALSCLGVTLAHAACPAGAIPIAVGQSIQAAVTAAPSGARFCIGEGLHRGQSVVPKTGQEFYFDIGSQMLGSKRVSVWTREGPLWFASGPTQAPPSTNINECLPAAPLCNQALAAFHAGVPLRQVASKAGVNADTFWRDGASGRIYIGRDPTKRAIEISTTESAFSGTASGVRIEGGVIRYYAPRLQRAAIHAADARGWTIHKVRVLSNYAVGIDVGSGSTVSNSVIDGNGQMGLACGGTGVVLSRNRITNNGRWAGLKDEWEGGGFKCTEIYGTFTTLNGKPHGTGLTAGHNRIEGNFGVGAWVDEGRSTSAPNSGVLIIGNRISRNTAAGVSIEISRGAARVVNNLMEANGTESGWMWGGCLQAYDSSNVEAYGNTCDVAAGHGNGMMVISQGGREVDACANHFHHNLIIFRGSNATTGVTGDNLPRFCGPDVNRLDHNAYFIARQADMTGPRWAWQDDEMGWATFRSRSGQEKQGTIAVGVPAGVSQ